MSPRRAQNPPLDREHVADDPMEQFARWFQEAESEVPLEQAARAAQAIHAALMS